VGKIARADGNLRVRRYALAVLRGVAELAATATVPKGNAA
jgi:hypothetical protein